MLFYPQLSSGNIAQFPLIKRFRRRVVENGLLDGTRIVQLGTKPLTRQWDLSYSELSDSEKTLLTDFHTTTEGRLRSFAFLDPTGNLLKWSEKLTKSVWTKDAGLAITEGISAPQGSGRACRVTNSSSLVQLVKQTVSAPASFTYCFSMQARAAEATVTKVQLSDGATSVNTLAVIGTSWSAYWISATLQSSSETIQFGIELPANSSIEVFGLNAMAQIAPGEYLKTEAESAVYGNVRFADDRLAFTTTGPNSNSMKVHLTTTG